MTPELAAQLQAIRERHERNAKPHPADTSWEGTYEWQLHQDVAILLALLSVMWQAALEAAAGAVCIGCKRRVLLLPPIEKIPVWQHDGYPYRCDASAIRALPSPVAEPR